MTAKLGVPQGFFCSVFAEIADVIMTEDNTFTNVFRYFVLGFGLGQLP
jgi:hypothetical protein